MFQGSDAGEATSLKPLASLVPPSGITSLQHHLVRHAACWSRYDVLKSSSSFGPPIFRGLCSLLLDGFLPSSLLCCVFPQLLVAKAFLLPFGISEMPLDTLTDIVIFVTVVNKRCAFAQFLLSPGIITSP